MKHATIIFLIAVVALGIYAIAEQDFFPTDDYVEMDVLELEGVTIAFGSGCKAIIADTSPERALAIQAGLDGVIELRPTIYDGFSETLDVFNMTIVSMAVESFDGQFYYSNLVVRNPTKVVKIDMKPSDAMALALRTQAKMYINKELLEAQGVDVCSDAVS